MSVLANTLNAYAARLKAQRRAQEREALKAARVKSQAQREAERAQRQAIRAQREQQQPKNIAVSGMNFYLDRVARRFKIDYNEQFRTGERAQVTRDLEQLCKLFFYTGPIPGNKIYKVIDTQHYSKTAYNILVSVLANAGMVDATHARNVVNYGFRKIVLITTTKGSTLTFAASDNQLDNIFAEYEKAVKANPNFGNSVHYVMKDVA